MKTPLHFVLALVCAATAVWATAGAKVTITVDCAAGETLKQPLNDETDKLTVKFSGTCIEDVSIDRGNVVLKGTDETAVIQGRVIVAAKINKNAAPRGGMVRLQGFTVDASASSGLQIGRGASVSASDLVVTNSANNGIYVYGGSFLRCIDCESTGNGGSGLLILTGASAELAGFGNYSNNGRAGITVSSSGALALFDSSADSAVLDTNIDVADNDESGIVASSGGSVISARPATGRTLTIEATGNGQDPADYGPGLFAATGGSMLLWADIDASGNDAGLSAFAGKMLIFGPVTAINSPIGLQVGAEGIVRLLSNAAAPSLIDLNGTGAYVDSGLLQQSFVDYTGNSQDVFLTFGAKAISSDTTATTVVCDGTSLARGTVICP